MTQANNDKPFEDKTLEILDNLVEAVEDARVEQPREYLEIKEQEFQEAQQALSQLFLTEVLDLIDGTEVLGPPHPQTNLYKKALKQTAQERYSKVGQVNG